MLRSKGLASVMVWCEWSKADGVWGLRFFLTHFLTSFDSLDLSHLVLVLIELYTLT